MVWATGRTMGVNSAGFLPSAFSADRSPFSLSRATCQNDLSRVSHDMIHFSILFDVDLGISHGPRDMV